MPLALRRDSGNLNMAADRRSETKTVSVASDGITQWVHLARLGPIFCKPNFGTMVHDYFSAMVEATSHLWAGPCV